MQPFPIQQKTQPFGWVHFFRSPHLPASFCSLAFSCRTFLKAFNPFRPSGRIAGYEISFLFL
jgi:hypothetical protein